MLGNKFIPLEQWSPTVLAPETGFLKDSFSADREWGRGRVGVGMGMGGNGSGGNASYGERWGAAGEVSLPATHFLLCSPVPNRLQTVLVHRLGGWGLLP